MKLSIRLESYSFEEIYAHFTCTPLELVHKYGLGKITGAFANCNETFGEPWGNVFRNKTIENDTPEWKAFMDLLAEVRKAAYGEKCLEDDKLCHEFSIIISPWFMLEFIKVCNLRPEVKDICFVNDILIDFEGRESLDNFCPEDHETEVLHFVWYGD